MGTKPKPGDGYAFCGECDGHGNLCWNCCSPVEYCECTDDAEPAKCDACNGVGWVKSGDD